MLGEEIQVAARTADLIDLIFKSQKYDEDVVRRKICNLNDKKEAKAAEQLKKPLQGKKQLRKPLQGKKRSHA